MRPYIRLGMLLIACTLLLWTCRNGFFDRFLNLSHREGYYRQLNRSDKAVAALWNSVAASALQNPHAVNLPYYESGHFGGMDATVYEIAVISGREVVVNITNHTGGPLFTEIFTRQEQGFDLVTEADTTVTISTASTFSGGNILIRVQPAAGKSGNFRVAIHSEPMLLWPVEATVKSGIISKWGAGRDGGSRSHEGIDIQARKGSDLIAVADGYVTRAGTNNLGGNIIFLRPDGMPFSVYYAHLDTHYVSSGTRVRAGQLLGTVGNSGNAQHTVAHVHFGIYTRGGAIDPIGFVQPSDALEFPKLELPEKKEIAIRKKLPLLSLPDKNTSVAELIKGDTLQIKGTTKNFYRILTNSGQTGFVEIKKI